MKQLINKVILVFYVLLSSTCLLLLGKSCPGTIHKFSFSGTREENLRKIKTRFANCKKIEGNLEISYLPLIESDLTFLSSIEEITGYVLFYSTGQTKLPLINLKIIRGRALLGLDNNSAYSLLIHQNTNLKDLGLISLTEISNGDVAFDRVDNLCYVDTVLWSDIFSNKSSTMKYNATSLNCNATCHISCPEFEGKRYCWGPSADQCQKLTKALCHEDCKGRCFGKDWNQCCSESCAGGCNGRSNKDCFRCRTFSNDGACVEFCPPPNIYNHKDKVWKKNPMFKYYYGFECVSSCPNFMYMDRGGCMRSCPEGYVGVQGECRLCDGSCAKSCPGTGDTFLSSKNIESFRGCTKIQGNLFIAQKTFKREYDYAPLTYGDISLLENVTLIEGSVRIDGDSPIFRNLSFLRNVKTIMANRPLLKMYGLFIFMTSLEFLGLDSLEEVSNGRLLISRNENLCYVEKFDWMNVRKNRSDILIADNKLQAECESEDRVCHDECAQDSCLGPQWETKCRVCRGYRQGNKCVHSCERGWFPLPNENGSLVCSKCHGECRGSCFGPGPDNCYKCLHYKDGRNCVEKCAEGSQTCKKSRKTKVIDGRRDLLEDILRGLWL